MRQEFADRLSSCIDVVPRRPCACVRGLEAEEAFRATTGRLLGLAPTASSLSSFLCPFDHAL